MKKTSYILLTILFFIITSCGDDDPENNFQIKFRGVATSAPVDYGNGVIITNFQISIKEIELKQDSASASNIKFAGPYAINLLNNSGVLSQTIGNTMVAAGNYKLIRFVLHKTRDVASTHPLYDRSIYLAGTINGTNFNMWHDTSENLDVSLTNATFPNGLDIGSSLVSVVIRFHIADFMSSSTNIDIRTATDDSGDSFIEINPNSSDGSINRDLADNLKNNIKAAADSYKE